MITLIKTKALVIKSIFVLSIVSTLPILAFAAEAEHEHNGSASDLVPYWIHFAAFVVILYFLIKNPITQAVVARREKISDGVNAGRRQLEEAEQKLSHAQKRFAQLAQSIEALKQEIASDTEREAKLLLADAIDRAARIKSNSENSASAEIKAAQLKIRNEVAERAIELAREQLRAKLNLDSDKALRSSALSGVSGLAN